MKTVASKSVKTISMGVSKSSRSTMGVSKLSRSALQQNSMTMMPRWTPVLWEIEERRKGCCAREMVGCVWERQAWGGGACYVCERDEVCACCVCERDEVCSVSENGLRKFWVWTIFQVFTKAFFGQRKWFSVWPGFYNKTNTHKYWRKKKFEKYFTAKQTENMYEKFKKLRMWYKYHKMWYGTHSIGTIKCDISTIICNVGTIWFFLYIKFK